MAGRCVVERDGYGASWPAQRALAYARAGRVCEKCGSRRGVYVHHKRKIALHLDHTTGTIDYAAANDLDNLIALCVTCHKAADGLPFSGFRTL